MLKKCLKNTYIGHGHWVNTLVSNTKRALKGGPYGSLEFAKKRLKFDTLSQAISHAKFVYKQLLSMVLHHIKIGWNGTNPLWV